jgi:hypothetical protein
MIQVRALLQRLNKQPAQQVITASENPVRAGNLEDLAKVLEVSVEHDAVRDAIALFPAETYAIDYGRIEKALYGLPQEQKRRILPELLSNTLVSPSVSQQVKAKFRGLYQFRTWIEHEGVTHAYFFQSHQDPVPVRDRTEDPALSPLAAGGQFLGDLRYERTEDNQRREFNWHTVYDRRTIETAARGISHQMFPYYLRAPLRDRILSHAERLAVKHDS